MARVLGRGDGRDPTAPVAVEWGDARAEVRPVVRVRRAMRGMTRPWLLTVAAPAVARVVAPATGVVGGGAHLLLSAFLLVFTGAPHRRRP